MSDETYHEWIEAQRAHVMPQCKLNKGVYYDIQCSPQDYLRPMLYVMRAVEVRGAKVNTVFPLRSDLIPKHFRMDTTTLVYLCMTKDIGTQAYYTTNGNLVRHQRRIWNFFFKTHLKCFHMEKDKHGYTFDHMIETDGISISLLLVRKDFIGKKVRKPKQGPAPPEQYIDELSDYSKIAKKKLVAIDPNMSDLLYCVDGPDEDKTVYRYTQDTRRKDTYVKKHRKYLETRKHEIIDGLSILEWEAELSAYNKKTTDFAAFETYVAKKNEMNLRLAPFYEDRTFRRMKTLSYIGRQRTEAKMIREFKAKFGNGEEAVVAIGDWEQRQHRKFKESIKGKGFKTLLRKAGYDMYLVDEFRTSCRCSHCEEHGECKTFLECENPRPYRSGRILRHGLVRCKTCQRLWNRDTNASSNIWKVADNAIHGLPRPAHLRRTSQANYTVGSDASSPHQRTRRGPSTLHGLGKV
jgi:transposase